MFLLALLAACTAPAREDSDPADTGDGSTGDSGDSSTGDSGTGDTGDSSTGGTGDSGTYNGPPSSAVCAESDAFVPQFSDEIARWVAEDDLAPGPASPLVFVGSSTIRRWEGLAAAYADQRPLQRGFGGAQLGEVAQSAQDLILRHAPRAVVVFAGTNDVDADVDPTIVVDRLRCLRARIAEGAPTAPVLYVGITPTLARWDDWSDADAVNDAVAALAEDDPGLVYVDVPAAFLATGSPPDATLFVDDGLHLSPAGYALWDSVLRPAVNAAVPPPPAPTFAALPPGTRFLIDLGPTDGANGERSGAPDWLGQTWNDAYDLAGGGFVLPGEHLGPLRTADGAPTEVELVVTGGFGANGRKNGGLLWPDPAKLGDLAVGTATEDYYYALPDDSTGGVWLRGLDPSASYTLRLFGTRDDAETRVTTYTVTGAATASASLQTSGAGAGSGGATGNDDDVATLSGVRPDAWGNVFVDVGIAEGPYGYLGIVAVTVE